MTSIGVAISTHAREQVRAGTVSCWAQHLGPATVLHVAHDVDGDGVAATKNRCLAALMDAGVEHLFLADDDVWPTGQRWWHPYVSNPEPHLMHCWGRARFVATRGDLTVWTWPRGVLLYVERRVVEAVGGMRTEYGRWGGEHAEWSRRIHNAGFTRHQYQDAAGAQRGVWQCHDYTRAVPSSVSARVRDDPARVAARREISARYSESTDFVPYRASL